MELKRKSTQGVLNIIRFNWHFYLIAFIILVILFLFKNQFSLQIQTSFNIVVLVAIYIISTSLLVSFYIYDLSDLYQLKWIENADNKKILNINAGFDETSEIIINKFPKADLTICDFYNPEKHTEVSIKRARRAYPPNPNTISVVTGRLPFLDNTFDQTFAILSAHEIRNQAERVQFFKELNRITKSSGQIFVTEHLRDFNNFWAYSIGFFHFHSHHIWTKTFIQANLTVANEIKTTPFITTFVLEKNGITN
ncbi:class I SAM-dependent methyltransferase [Epilithonimonas tenax]|uniref:class I SAM-dependent methyltransferase n=1 Tax=Epilithonimonas tenax TaxID=191577 RepID=UPI00041C4026|nr:methyltransferase domain-containing protein [Epilithonimonas tenax]